MTPTEAVTDGRCCEGWTRALLDEHGRCERRELDTCRDALQGLEEALNEAFDTGLSGPRHSASTLEDLADRLGVPPAAPVPYEPGAAGPDDPGEGA
jgi:hypothetical protein